MPESDRSLKKTWNYVRAQLSWRRKIRIKIILIVLLLAVLPLSIFCFITLRMGLAYVYLYTARETQEKVTHFSKTVELFYGDHFKRALQAALTLHPEDLESARAHDRYLEQLLSETPDTLLVTLAAPSGRLSAYRSLTPLSEALIREQGHFHSHPLAERGLAGDLGQVQILPDLPQPLLPLRIPLRPSRHGPGWTVTYYFSLQTLWQNLLLLHFGPDTDIFLINPQGEILFDSQVDGALRPDQVRSQPNHLLVINIRGSQVLPPPSVFPHSNRFGYRVQSASAPCPLLNWTITLERNAKIIHRQTATLQILIFSFWGISMLFSVLGGIWFVTKLVHPIEELEAGIKLVSSGLMGDELPVRSQDEIGRLTETFNQMTRTLMLRNEEIRGKTRELTFFNAITRIINQSVDLKTFLDNSLQKILQLLHATAGIAYVFHPVRKELHPHAVYGFSEAFLAPQAQADFKQELIARIFNSREPLMLRYLRRHSGAQHLLRSEGIQELLLVPLQSKTRAMGVLLVASRRKHSFHYRDLVLLASIGDEIGVAVDNALLYEELQRKIQELEKAYQELQELDRFKSRFLSNVSHELRTPITSIKTYVELFLQDKIGVLQEEQKEKLEIVRRNLNSLMTLINDLLAIARVEDQKDRPSQKEKIPIQDIVDQALADTVEIAKGKGLQLLSRIASKKYWVEVDRQKILQVIQNLISNAIKFTERGEILVSVKRMEGDGSPPQVEVAVNDTGIGIPTSELPKIFQRFYQIDSSPTRKYVGTGLGLAIVKEILAGHGTQIHVDSTPGEGSRFWFTLPVLDAEPPGPARA